MQYLVFFLLFALLGGANVYLAHHTWRWVHHLLPKFPFWISLVFFLIMTVMMALSMLKPFSGHFQQVICAVGAIWMGIFVYLLLSYLVADVAVLLPRILRLVSQQQLVTLRFAAGITATALALSICVYGVFHAQKLTHKEYEVALSQSSTQQLHVVLISDVHLGAIGSEARLERIVAQINRLEPDLVCIAGDFFDTDFRSIQDPEKAIALMKTIRARYGVYACLGNHDAGKTIGDMLQFMEQANVTVLNDAYTLIGDRLILAGRLDGFPIGGAGSLERAELSQVLQDAPALPLVVLDHNPSGVDSYDRSDTLVLSGHTHKGQIFPGSLITGAMYTVDYGYHRTQAGVQAIVTSGAGIWGLPMRVGTNCEIVSIQLKY